MWPEVPPEQWCEALDATIEELLDATDCHHPPVNALTLAAKLGLIVAIDQRQASRARYVRLAAPAAARELILLRPDPRPERRQWAVAHEIGEHISHRVFARLGINAGESVGAREAVANTLASRLLLPQAWFAHAVDQVDGCLFALKERFPTASHELIARRMLELPRPVVIAIYDQGKLQWRRSNLPGRLPRMSCEEQAVWQCCHASGEVQHASSDCWDVTAWPIHEPDWTREIVQARPRWDDTAWGL